MKQQFLEIQSTTESKVELQSSQHQNVKLWLVFPCLGALTIGLSQFMLSEIMRYCGELRYQYGQWYGFALMALIYNGNVMFNNLRNSKPILNHYDGIYKTPQCQLKKLILFGFIIRCIIQAVILKFFAMVNHYAIKSGTSPSIMICLTASSSIISSVIMYFLKNERLTRIQMASIFLLLLSVCFICGSKAIKFESNIENSEISVFVPITLALCLALFICLAQIIAKLLMTNGYKSSLLITDIFLCQAIIVLPFYIYEEFNNPYQTKFIIWIAIQAILNFLGQGLANIGLQYGKVGPNIAIIQNSVAIQFILEEIVYQQLPNIFEIIGLILCIGGIAINAFRK